MYQSSATVPQACAVPVHPQSNPWTGEISGTASVLPYTDPAAQQSSISPESASSQLNMSHDLPESMIATPQSVDEAYMGSLKSMLSQNVGNHIVASFLMGTQNLMSWEGILYEVGNNYLTIYQPSRGRYIVGDLYSLKFTEFYERTKQSNGSQYQSTGGWQQPV